MEAKFNEKVHIMNHPLVAHKLTIMRDENTSVKDFRELVSEIGMLITYEATRDLPLQDIEIETPIQKTTAKVVAGRKLVVVPILRAGLGMVDGMMTLLPAAKVGHIGLYRDPDTHKPVEYYCKLPEDMPERDVIVVDPMLATGGSAIDAVTQIKQRNPHSIKFVCMIAAPEGLKAFTEAHPDVPLFTASNLFRTICKQVLHLIPALATPATEFSEPCNFGGKFLWQ